MPAFRHRPVDAQQQRRALAGSCYQHVNDTAATAPTKDQSRMSLKTPASRDILARLIAFDTTSRNSNLPLLDYVESYLKLYGVTSRRVTRSPEPKANLFATIGPDVEGGIILSGHTDCVPVDNEEWTSDPFVLTERRGRLHGRGSA